MSENKWFYDDTAKTWLLRPDPTPEQRAAASRKAINDVDKTPPPALVKADVMKALQDA